MDSNQISQRLIVTAGKIMTVVMALQVYSEQVGIIGAEDILTSIANELYDTGEALRGKLVVDLPK